MRVLHVSNFLPGYHKIWGGAEQIALRTLNLLEKESVSVAAATTSITKKNEEKFEIYPVKTLKDYAGFLLKGHILLMKNCGIIQDPVSFFSFNAALNRAKPDVVHFHKFEEFSFSLLLCAILRKIPVVVSIYDYFYFCPNETLTDNAKNICRKFSGALCVECLGFKSLKFPKKIFFEARKKIFKFFLNKINAFAVLSESSKSILKSYGIKEDKIFVVKQPVCLEDNPQESLNLGGNMILYAGWMQERKGLHVIMEAMKDIVKEVNGAKLVVCGEIEDKEYYESVKTQIKNYGLKDNVEIKGKMPYAEVKKLFCASSVVVVPEQWENMSPAVLTEAMNCGKPVVASRIGGIPEFIDDGKDGFLINPKDPAGFAEKIIKILKDKNLAQELGANAKKKIEKLFTKEETIGKLIGVYNGLVRR